MALLKRNAEHDQERDESARRHARSPSPEADYGYQPGGQVGQLHADLARRLAQERIVLDAGDTPGERLVRLLSRSGGYAALLTGYVVVAVLVLR